MSDANKSELTDAVKIVAEFKAFQESLDPQLVVCFNRVLSDVESFNKYRRLHERLVSARTEIERMRTSFDHVLDEIRVVTNPRPELSSGSTGVASTNHSHSGDGVKDLLTTTNQSFFPQQQQQQQGQAVSQATFNPFFMNDLQVGNSATDNLSGQLPTLPPAKLHFNIHQPNIVSKAGLEQSMNGDSSTKQSSTSFLLKDQANLADPPPGFFSRIVEGLAAEKLSSKKPINSSAVSPSPEQKMLQGQQQLSQSTLPLKDRDRNRSDNHLEDEFSFQASPRQKEGSKEVAMSRRSSLSESSIQTLKVQGEATTTLETDQQQPQSSKKKRLKRLVLEDSENDMEGEDVASITVLSDEGDAGLKQGGAVRSITSGGRKQGGANKQLIANSRKEALENTSTIVYWRSETELNPATFYRLIENMKKRYPGAVEMFNSVQNKSVQLLMGAVREGRNRSANCGLCKEDIGRGIQVYDRNICTTHRYHLECGTLAKLVSTEKCLCCLLKRSQA